MMQDPTLIDAPTLSAHQQHMVEWHAKNRDRCGVFSAAKAEAGELEVSIIGAIGDSFFAFDPITTKSVKRQLDANPNAKVIRVLIDSPGGSVFDGVAIMNLLKRHSARVEVEVIGEAASAASVVAMAGDKISIHEGAMMMIHRASTMAWGFDTDLMAAADALSKITDSIIDLYAARSPVDRAQIVRMVNKETWLSAREAVEKGFADEVIPGRDSSNASKRAKAISALPVAGSGFEFTQAVEDLAEPISIPIVSTPVVDRAIENIAAKVAKETPVTTTTEVTLLDEFDMTDEERAELVAQRVDEAATAARVAADNFVPSAEEIARVKAKRADALKNSPISKARGQAAPAFGGFTVRIPA